MQQLIQEFDQNEQECFDVKRTVSDGVSEKKRVVSNKSKLIDMQLSIIDNCGLEGLKDWQRKINEEKNLLEEFISQVQGAIIRHMGIINAIGERNGDIINELTTAITAYGQDGYIVSDIVIEIDVNPGIFKKIRSMEESFTSDSSVVKKCLADIETYKEDFENQARVYQEKLSEFEGMIQERLSNMQGQAVDDNARDPSDDDLMKQLEDDFEMAVRLYIEEWDQLESDFEMALRLQEEELQLENDRLMAEEFLLREERRVGNRQNQL